MLHFESEVYMQRYNIQILTAHEGNGGKLLS